MKEETKALVLRVEGSVTANNFAEFKSQFTDAIDKANAHVIQTEDDVNLIAKTCDMLRDGEKAMQAAKQAALDSTADIKEVFATLDQFTEQVAESRKALKKKAEEWKEKERDAITDRARDALFNLYQPLFEAYPFFKNKTEINYSAIYNAIKGKRNLKGIQSAVDAFLADEATLLEGIKAKFDANKAILQPAYDETPVIFSDYNLLMDKDTETLQAIVGQRQAEYKVQKQKEEEAAKAEAERKAAEEKARAEEEAKKAEAEKAQEPEVVEDPTPVPEEQVEQPTLFDEVEEMNEVLDHPEPVVDDSHKIERHEIVITVQCAESTARDIHGQIVGFLDWKKITGVESVETKEVVVM